MFYKWPVHLSKCRASPARQDSTFSIFSLTHSLPRPGSRPTAHLLAADLSPGLVRGSTNLPGQKGLALSWSAWGGIYFNWDTEVQPSHRICMSPVRTSSPPRRRLPVPLGILTSSSFCAPLQESNSKPQSGSRVASSRAIRSPTQVVSASGPGRLSTRGADAQEQMRGSRCAGADAQAQMRGSPQLPEPTRGCRLKGFPEP